MRNSLKHTSIIYGIIFLCLFVPMSLLAQVTGVGTRPPDAATVLEVSSDNKTGGLLLPRVQLSNNVDVTTIPNPASGLLVYNLASSGTGDARVDANRVYFWNGTQWKDIADRQLVRRLLLPPVFFAQCEGSETSFNITGGSLTNLNDGTGFTVPFPTNSVLVNNYNNITLNNNTFRVNNAGSYEVSAFINYYPGIYNGYNNEDNNFSQYNRARTALEFRIQRSTNNGGAWADVATTRATWSLLTGAFFRNVTMPPLIIQDLEAGDLLRLVIARPNNYGGTHGSNSSSGVASISVGEGTVITRNIRMLKIE